MKKSAFIAAAIALVVIAPTAGQAAKGDSSKSCPDDAICVWTKKGSEGKRVVVEGNDVSNKIANQINNRTTSIKNGFDQTILIYDKRNATGEARCLSGLAKERNLGNSYNFNNRAASSDVPDDPEPCV